MNDGQSAFAGPMTMQEALDKFDSVVEEAQAEPDAKEDKTEETSQETETQAENATAEAEADDAEQPEQEEPHQEDDGPQVLTVEEYGDVQVDVNGNATSLKSLIDGNLMQADYTRKTQALKEREKSLEAEIAQKEKEIADREQQLNERLSQLDNEPDWEKLAEDDPLGFISEKAKWDKKKAAAEAAEKQLLEKREKEIQSFVRKTAEVAVQIMPEWADAEKFDKGADARKQAALAAGFTEQEYNQAGDFRLAVLLEKAARYDAGQADTKKKVDLADKRIARAPKVLKPGTGRTVDDPKAERRAAISKRFSKPIQTDDIRKMLGR